MSVGRGWPVTIDHPPLRLRPVRVGDVGDWAEVQSRNRDWLAPWEATSPDAGEAMSFASVVRRFRRDARAGRMIPLVVEVDGRMRGQVTVSQIVWGSARTASIGYWIDEAVAGRGIIPTAVALVIDHCFGVVGLHRIEVNIRPENTASLAVARKLGLRDEGIRRDYIHIDGAWRDHLSFAVTADEVPGGMLARLSARGHDMRRSGI